MRSYSFPIVCVALVAVCAATSGAASTNPSLALFSGDQLARARPRAAVTARTGDLRGNISVGLPTGCSAPGAQSFIGGGQSNVAGGAGVGVLAGVLNKACDRTSAIGGGYANIIGGDGQSFDAIIAGGDDNLLNDDPYGFMGGGYFNTIGRAAGSYGSAESAIISGQFNIIGAAGSMIGAGYANTIVGQRVPDPMGTSSFIGAGDDNAIAADWAFIGGGYNNTNSANYATLAGGFDNIVSGVQAVVSGGYGNAATGKDAAIPGGSSNVASGANTFAAGTKSSADTDGAFVWSDNAAGATQLKSSTSNQFLVRASGGVDIYSDPTLRSGVILKAGSGSWASLSDRNAKTDVAVLDPATILAKVAALPITEWSYRTEDPAIRHVGPMAQDFYAAFGLGEDVRHITSIDEEGVALAAIQALQVEVVEKNRRLDDSARKLDDLRTKYASIEKRLDALEETSRVKELVGN